MLEANMEYSQVYFQDEWQTMVLFRHLVPWGALLIDLGYEEFEVVKPYLILLENGYMKLHFNPVQYQSNLNADANQIHPVVVRRFNIWTTCFQRSDSAQLSHST